MPSPKVSIVLVPGASAPAGINTIKSLKMADFVGKIVKLHQVQVLMPSSGFDIYPYSENYKELAEMGALEDRR